MRKGTHKELANRILRELALEVDPSAYAFRKAVTAPDRWGESEPHHSGRGRDIEERILEARRLRLLGDDKGCMRNLGVALHYLQDGWTHTTGRGAPHRAYERLVDEAPLSPDLQGAVSRLQGEAGRSHEAVALAIAEGKGGKDATLGLAAAIPGEGTPASDKTFAYAVSLRVTRSVLFDEPPPELTRRLERLRSERDEKLAALNRGAREDKTLRGAFFRGGLVGRAIARLLQWRIGGASSRIHKEYEARKAALLEPYGEWYGAGEEPRRPAEDQIGG